MGEFINSIRVILSPHFHGDRLREESHRKKEILRSLALPQNDISPPITEALHKLKQKPRHSRMMSPSFDKINRENLTYQKTIETQQYLQNNPLRGGIINAGTGKALTTEELQKDLENYQRQLEIGTTNLKKIDAIIPWVFRVQVFSFLLGILLNIIFSTINYL
ncbi:MAG: hypothetical protein A3B70_08650 [Deltaproteobacteria bacterium RIFCSPHIGHO2_02_FULL_40_11]|nr:MAG: hypothetical protein A3B70_08650 [Deltaproteobacteria bacterium RIFCSPHIGHO2_02_FULL_40_11]